MKHLFVPYELAKLAKEKGFNDECIAEYITQKEEPLLTFYRNIGRDEAGLDSHCDCLVTYKNSSPNYFVFNPVCAPLYQQLVDWFREEHNTHVFISPPDGVFKYCVSIKYHNYRDQNGGIGYNAYYEALTAALTKAFELI